MAFIKVKDKKGKGNGIKKLVIIDGFHFMMDAF